MIVFAIDPGPHTGLAEYIVCGTEHAALSQTIFADRPNMFRWLHLLLEKAHKIDTDFRVVCESFRTTAAGVGMTNEAILTLHLCGFVEGWCAIHNVPLIWHTPGMRKAYQADVRRLMPKTAHELSALAHGMAYLVKEGFSVSDFRPQ